MLNRTYFFERGVGAVLLDGFETLRRDVHDDGLIEFGDVDAALLKVRLAADLAGWIKLRRAGAIGVPPANLRTLPGNFTSACHSGRMVA